MSLLADRGHRIISVEGLNKFYWEGTEGRPVATWMTSHHRLDEIVDFCRMLTAIYEQECLQARRVIVLGFSQGATTIWRWLHRDGPPIHGFVNVAGSIPSDINLSGMPETYPMAYFAHLYSETDVYLTDERRDAVIALAQSTGLDIDFIKYEGGHRVVPTSLIPIYERWE